MTIPLTFDWLTLAWLKTRLSLWWRAQRPVRAWLLLWLSALSGCVPVTRFEESQSAAQVEMEGRRRSEQQLRELEKENAELRARMQQDSAALEERDERLSQAELSTVMQGKQQKEAEGMVEQLRGELQRVGGHLQAFHEEKQKLQAELGSEQERSERRARLTRDLALTLAEPLKAGEYTLDTAKEAVVLRVPRSEVFATDGSLKSSSASLLDAVGKVLLLHKTTTLRLEDSSAPGDAIAVQRVVAALTERAVAAERFEPLLPDAAAAAPTDEPELLFGFTAL